jgi:hypothetical protein
LAKNPRMTTTTTSGKRYFACAHRGFIQIRVAKKPPKPKIEALTKEVEREYEEWVPNFIYDSYGYGFDNGQYVTRKRVQKEIIQVVSFTGGKIISQVSPQMFIRRTRRGLREGVVVELSPTTLEKLIGRIDR